MISGGLTIIKSMYDSLPPAEKKVAECIMNNPQQVVGCTVAELAKMSGTSDAAVIRLCKSLDFKGFSELKLRIAGDLQKPPEEQYFDIQPDEEVDELVDKISSNNIKAIRETMAVLNRGEIKRAVEAMKQSRHILFYGVGASYIIALDAQQKFMRINKNCSAYPDYHIAAVAAANATEHDVVFGISYSGETKEVAEVLQLAKNNAATIITLTKIGKPTISDLADIRLFTPASIESELRSAATASRIAQLNIIDILFHAVASDMYPEAITYLKRTREATKNHRWK